VSIKALGTNYNKAKSDFDSEVKNGADAVLFDWSYNLKHYTNLDKGLKALARYFFS
jgi:hypothetical protein